MCLGFGFPFPIRGLCCPSMEVISTIPLDISTIIFQVIRKSLSIKRILFGDLFVELPLLSSSDMQASVMPRAAMLVSCQHDIYHGLVLCQVFYIFVAFFYYFYMFIFLWTQQHSFLQDLKASAQTNSLRF